MILRVSKRLQMIKQNVMSHSKRCIELIKLSKQKTYRGAWLFERRYMPTGQPGRRERGAAHPSDPAAINWAAAHEVTFFLFFLFSVYNYVLKT
jgi:hypothetical protein